MRAVALVTVIAALSLMGLSFAKAQTTTPRPIDNVGNNPADVYAGSPNQQLLRLDVPSTYFADASGALFPGSLPPATVGTDNTTYPAFQCIGLSQVPPAQPYPRCVSDLVNGYTNAPLALQIIDPGVLSVRKVSHFESFWAQLLSYDLLDVAANAEQVNIGIPIDDVAINTGPSGVSAAVITNSNHSIEFHRASYVVEPATQQQNRTGINSATGFLDASLNSYSRFLCQLVTPCLLRTGSTDAVLQTLHDGPGTHGKMKLVAQSIPFGSTGEPGPLPPLSTDGRFLLGNNPLRSANIYSDAMTIIFLREHNRQCDRLYLLHGTTWTDDQYFQEARKWVIAFVQKITATEYLGVLLGRPLPPYTGYKQDVKPGIDTFFAMASFRYGHSVLSSEYRIVDSDAQLIESLNLYRSQGNAQAPVNDTGAYALSNVNATIVGGTAVVITFTRAMDTGVAGKAVFGNSKMNVIWAYNPEDSNPTYHGGNRGGIQINFLSGMIADINNESQRMMQLVHGVFMFAVWAVLFPVSIYIMRSDD
ncbi:LOW QUALITY PROTEIN: heme peroxidase [Jimgerdemannia flammicorona]|uniref:Heme peroxidase n=1 Tax=Jimgerdemannia flammicorona TaxID=994334 RepID=A0A433DMA7_9FUNG|nr:LOW QUALITY PROTEIN: heme peroxidase [Jimgerdemannia flammicorona]